MKCTCSKYPAKFGLAFCTAFMILLFAAVLPAQTFYGSILGTITDSSGGVIPGANITLTNIGTSENRTMVSDNNGAYRFVNLVPGRYRLDVEMAGFKRLTREPIEVTVEAAVRINAVLQVGNISETVEVSSQTPLLQTESSSVSQVVEGRHVLEMPLNGRNLMSLVGLVAGVVPQGGMSGNPLGNQQSSTMGSHTANQGWNNYQMGGGIAGQSASFLDGSPINVIGQGGNPQALVPTQDAIQEFRVVNNNVSAEFGRYSGGIVNMTTKSGANGFHGSAYEFLRNRALNANNFFSNASGQPKPSWVQNQYGVTLGGPVIKDKTFFFFSWENYNVRQGVPSLNFVPTAAQRTGNFGSTAVYDPLTTCGYANNPACAGGVVTRTKFANNVIPSNRIDPVADRITNIIKYWPMPNVSQSGGNFFSQPVTGGDTSSYNGRIDHNISDKQRLFGRFTFFKTKDISYNPMLNQNGNPAATNKTYHIVVGDTYTFTPTTFLDFRASYLRENYEDRPPSYGTDLTQFGPSWTSLDKLVQFHFLPKVVVTGLYGFGSQNNYTDRRWNNSVLSGSITKLQGRHTLKFGGEVRLLDMSMVINGQATGQFNFNSAFTSSNGSTAGSAGGNPFASFLLGDVQTGVIANALMTATYNWYQGYYFTDTFQVSKKLTLNLGIRWELPGAFAERHDLATVLQPDAVDPLSQSTGMSLKGQLALTNSQQYPDRTLLKVKHNLFAPRVGFAYRVTDNTVIRGGYGIAYLPTNVNGASPAYSPIINAILNMAPSVNNAGLYPAATLNCPFPADGIVGNTQQAILQPPVSLSALEGQAVNGMIPDQPYPYMQQWNLVFEHQFPGNTLIEMAYAGARGTHLAIGTGSSNSGVNLNQLPSQYFSMGQDLLTAVPNPMYGKLPSSSPLNKPTISKGQLLVPHPQFQGFVSAGMQVGDTIYHAMMVKTEKRFGSGGVLMANYTWAKMIGTSDQQNATIEIANLGLVQDYNNFRGERSLLSFDVPHRAVISYVLDAPFGKGKKYLSGTTGALGKLVSGWGVNGIISFRSGFPLALTAQANSLSSSFYSGTIRPNRVAGCNPIISGSAQSRLSKWFDTSCFSQPGSFSFGNESRTDPNLRSAGQNNFDFALFKTTHITETVNVQFRAEIFNLFNRVQFGPPGIQVGNSSFGVVSSQVNQPRQIQFALRLTF
jgi:hypothetical protein